MNGLLTIFNASETLHAISDGAEQHWTFAVGHTDQAPTQPPDTPQGPGTIKEHST